MVRKKDKLFRRNLCNDALRAHKVDSSGREAGHYHSLAVERKNVIQAAKDLCYGDEVISRLYAAKTMGELEQIMNTARKRTLE